MSFVDWLYLWFTLFLAGAITYFVGEALIDSFFKQKEELINRMVLEEGD